MLDSALRVGLALAVAVGLHFPLWWMRHKALGLVSGFGFLCFIPLALIALSAGGSSEAPATQWWIQLGVIGFFVGPLLLGLYHSFWLESSWSKWLWAKAFFAVYTEGVLAFFAYELVSEALNANRSSLGLSALFSWVYGLTLLLLVCFGPCLGRFVRLAVPLIREA